MDIQDTTKNDESITLFRKDYIPRDKINEGHILTIIGNRYRHNPEKIQTEMHKCQQMKSKFMTYARKIILNGYIQCAKDLGWKVNGQDLTTLSNFKSYISLLEWNNKTEKELHFLQYKRFKKDIKLYRWDYKLSDDFCRENNIRFHTEEKKDTTVESNEGGKKQMRSCFVILATSIKNDYNKKIRLFYENAHGKCIKERKMMVHN